MIKIKSYVDAEKSFAFIRESDIKRIEVRKHHINMNAVYTVEFLLAGHIKNTYGESVIFAEHDSLRDAEHEMCKLVESLNKS